MAKKESYEELVFKLENILADLEKNELNLEDTIKSYEEGVKLVNKAYKTLNNYEKKICVIRDEKEVEFNQSGTDK